MSRRSKRSRSKVSITVIDRHAEAGATLTTVNSKEQNSDNLYELVLVEGMTEQGNQIARLFKDNFTFLSDQIAQMVKSTMKYR